MPERIEFGKFVVGNKSPAFIIAEVGVNHNGDLNLAKDLIYKAAECGANCVKFQTFKAERVVLADAPKAHYQLKTTDAEESQLQMLKKLELDRAFYEEVIDCCDRAGVFFMSTPYNEEDLEFLENLQVKAYKLASIHAAEPSFAAQVASTGKPVILSTGMATLAEIDQTLRAIRHTGNNKVILLQCTTNYPSNAEDTNLLAMQTMRDVFGVLAGYSDHTTDEVACIASIALGAKVIEKHFTLDKSLPGPDHTSSSEPDEFASLVEKIRQTEKCLGSSFKRPCDVEIKNAVGMRRSIVAKKDIPIGTVLKNEHLTFKRPGTGLSPALLGEILGKKNRKEVTYDQLINWSDIE